MPINETKKVKGKFQYDRDTDRYHRFKIETETGIVGTIYVPKGKADAMPKELLLEYAEITE